MVKYEAKSAYSNELINWTERGENNDSLYEDAVLSIAVSNSYKAEPVLTEDGYIRTTKKDREEHGWGMRNVVATLEKYNAEYIIDYNKLIYEIYCNRTGKLWRKARRRTDCFGA